MELHEIATFGGVFVGGAIAAYVGYKQKWLPSTSGKHLELAGALVDSKAVIRLTAAIEAHNVEMVAARADREKGRTATYRMIEVGGKIADEVEELRRAVADVATQIARMK